MCQTRSLDLVRPLLPLAALVAILNGPVNAQTQVIQTDPMQITTDTPEYCQKLLTRLGELLRLATAPVPQEVDDLTFEGQRMCDHGQTRSGIMRLRSALLIMEKGNGPAYR